MIKPAFLLFLSILGFSSLLNAQTTRYIVFTRAHGEVAQMRVAAAVTDGPDLRANPH